MQQQLSLSRPIFWGEVKCSQIMRNNKQCTNMAYFHIQGVPFCGMHARKDDKHRENLPRNPMEFMLRRMELERQRDEIHAYQLENKKLNYRGSIILQKMFMLKTVPYTTGYLNIFPNYRHQNRIDGFGCASLSPKSIGPIYHNQPNLPPALNLENFHQSNKLFPNEVLPDGSISQQFFTTQLKFYTDPEPHRHKQKGVIPVCSIWISKDGSLQKISYVESRQLYCHFYEQAVVQLEDFKTLQNKVKDGFNLKICGYDATPLRPDETIMDAYLDDSKPFGHEMVLYTLLTSSPPFPWHVHKTLDFT